MTGFLHAAKNFLSKKSTTIAIIAFSIVGRIIQLVYFFNIRLDASHQVIATRNLLEGYGISMAKASPEDLSTFIYEPLINWPPGYSILLAPFYAMFDGNYVAAGLTLGILSAIALILISRSILKLLNVPLYLINISTLIGGFFIYFFYFIASSDAITISFAMIGLYYGLSLLQSSEQSLKKTVGIAISLFICGAIKYLFIPVVLVIPLYIAWKGIAQKEKILTRAGIVSLLTLLVIFGVILAWQKSTSGSATYISEPGRGFFPSHLLAYFPFIPASFIKPDTIMMLLPGNFPASFLFIFLKLLHVVTLLLFSLILLKKIFQVGLGRLSLQFDFFNLTLFISLAITLLLAILSLQVEKEAWQGGHRWTYIEEHRYYGLPIVMIQLAVFVYYHHWRNRLNKLARSFLLFLFILMMTEAVRGVIFDARRISRLGKEEYSWQSEYKMQQYADSLVRHARIQRPVKTVVVGGPFYYVNHRVSLYSNVPLLDKPESINDLESLRTKKPTLLLVILSDKDKKNYQPFLRSGIEVAGQINGLYFYTVYVEPR